MVVKEEEEDTLSQVGPESDAADSMADAVLRRPDFLLCRFVLRVPVLALLPTRACQGGEKDEEEQRRGTGGDRHGGGAPAGLASRCPQCAQTVVIIVGMDASKDTCSRTHRN